MSVIRLLAVLAALALSPLAAGSAELTASVDALSGAEITLLIDGQLDPAVGDRVSITVSGFDEDATGSVVGQIVSVETGTGKARARLESAPGVSLWPGLPVVISSPAPTERRTAQNDPWMQSLADIENLELPPTAPTIATQTTDTPDGAGGAEPDPSDPATAGYILHWIRTASPLANATPGSNLRFTDWAQMVGTTATGTITANAKPDDAAAYADPALYLWARHQALGSLDLCTLGEFVRARISGQASATCAVQADGTPPSGDATRPGDVAQPGNFGQPEIIQESAETENGSAATALAISPNSRISATVQPKYDQDWYRIVPDHHGELTVRVREQPPGLGLRVAVHPKGGNWLPGVGDSNSEQLSVDLGSAIPHFLKVDSSLNAENAAPYHLDVSFIKSPDLHEPNPNAGAAKLLPLDGNLLGTILPRYDQDWFELNPGHHGELTLTTSGEPEGLGTRLGVHAKGGNWLPDVSKNDDKTLVVDLATPVLHYFKVDSAKNLRSVEPYSISMSFRPSPDQHEPNADAKGAKPLPLDGDLIGTVLPRYDQDWFELSPDHHGELTLKIAGEPEGLGTRLGVHAKGGNWLPDVSKDDDKTHVVDLATPVTHYFKVDSAKNLRSVEPYSISMSFRPSPDQHEPNADAKGAKPLPLDGDLIGTVLPRYDQDWFELSPDHHGELTLKIAGEPEGLGTRLGVHAKGGNWLRDVSAEGDGTLVVDLATPVTHYFKIDSAKNLRSVEPYSISMSFRPSPDQHEPNADAKGAKPLPLNGNLRGTILPRYDQDWFELSPEHHGELTLKISGAPEDLGTRLGVHAKGGNWLRDVSAEGDNTLVVDLATPVTHYFKIDSAKNLRSVEPYMISMTFRPSPDQHEPNADAKGAKPLPASGNLLGTVLPRYDQDWFRFQAAKGSRINVSVNQADADIALRVGVHPEGGNWLSNKAPDGSGALVFETSHSGTHFLKVDSAKNLRSVEPYSVSVSVN